MLMGLVGIWLLVDIEGGWNELVSWAFDVLVIFCGRVLCYVFCFFISVEV